MALSLAIADERVLEALLQELTGWPGLAEPAPVAARPRRAARAAARRSATRAWPRRLGLGLLLGMLATGAASAVMLNATAQAVGSALQQSDTVRLEPLVDWPVLRAAMVAEMPAAALGHDWLSSMAEGVSSRMATPDGLVQAARAHLDPWVGARGGSLMPVWLNGPQMQLTLPALGAGPVTLTLAPRSPWRWVVVGVALPQAREAYGDSPAD